MLRQSLPFSYVTVNVSGKSGATPEVQILTAIDDSGTGVQGNLHLSLENTGITIGATYMFNVSDPSETYYKENIDMAAWGSVVLATTQTILLKFLIRAAVLVICTLLLSPMEI